MDVQPRRFVLQALDAAVYVVALAIALVVGTAPISVAVGFGLVGVKWALFVVGFVLLAYATLSLKPGRPGERADEKKGWDTRGERSTVSDPDGASRPSGMSGIADTSDAPETSGASDASGPAAGSVQRLLGDALPPRVRLPPEERLPPGVKLFVAGAGLLLTSYLMETLLGVGL